MQLVGALVWISLLLGIPAAFGIVGYWCGRFNGCPQIGTFVNSCWKGRIPLLHVPMTVIIAPMLIFAAAIGDLKSLANAVVVLWWIYGLQAAFAAAEVGILHGQVRSKGRTVGLAAAYGRERKRRWVRLLLPVRIVVLNAILGELYREARVIRASA